MTTITAQHADTLLEALRSNLDLLGELAARYQVPTRRETPRDLPSIGSPEDVYFLLGPGDGPACPGTVAGCCSSTPGTRS